MRRRSYASTCRRIRPRRLRVTSRTTWQPAVRAGITTVVDPQSYLEDLDMYARLRREGKLPTRLQVALFHRRGTTQEMLQQFEQARSEERRVGKECRSRWSPYR